MNTSLVCQQAILCNKMLLGNSNDIFIAAKLFILHLG